MSNFRASSTLTGAGRRRPDLDLQRSLISPLLCLKIHPVTLLSGISLLQARVSPFFTQTLPVPIEASPIFLLRDTTMARLSVSYTIFLAVAVLLSAYGACAEEFLLSSAVSNSIVLLDSVTGLERPFIKATGLLDHPDSMVFHPSTGRLLVSTGKTKATSKVLQFDARTGEYLGRFDDGTFSFPMYITPFYHISLSLAPSRPYERSTWGDARRRFSIRPEHHPLRAL